MIRFRFLKGGAFVAGDTKTGRTVYISNTSPAATRAHNTPTITARELMRHENRQGYWRDQLECSRDFDSNNWKLLNEENDA